MKTVFLSAALLLASCLNDPNSAPEISTGQIEGLSMELRVGKYASFTKNASDTLPKHIQSGDSATKAVFATEQVNAWVVISGFPKGVQANIVVNTVVKRGTQIESRPASATAKMNTCCVEDWGGTTTMQLQLPFWNKPEDLPFSMVFEVQVQNKTMLVDSLTIE